MATEKGSAADSSVYIGYRTASGETFSFPFFKEMENEAERFSQSDENDIVKRRCLLRASLETSACTSECLALIVC